MLRWLDSLQSHLNFLKTINAGLAFKALLIGLVILLCFESEEIFAAEILQIRSSSVIQIGDNNRVYTIKLACLDTESSDEKEVRDWLRRELPRKMKVNIRPRGSMDGLLLASLTPIGEDHELSESIADAGLAKYGCPNSN